MLLLAGPPELLPGRLLAWPALALLPLLPLLRRFVLVRPAVMLLAGRRLVTLRLRRAVMLHPVRRRGRLLWLAPAGRRGIRRP